MGLLELAFAILVFGIAATSVCAFILFGVLVLAAPKRAMLAMAWFDRTMRKALLKDDWNDIERFMLRRGWLQPWAIPSNVDIKTPEDMRRYWVSDQAIESGRFWIARVWAVGAILLGGFALVVLIAVPFQ